VRVGSGRAVEDSLYDIEKGTWTALPTPPLPPASPEPEANESPDPLANPGSAPYWRRWIGPRTLAVSSRAYLAFEDVDAPGTLRYVAGGP